MTPGDDAFDVPEDGGLLEAGLAELMELDEEATGIREHIEDHRSSKDV